MKTLSRRQQAILDFIGGFLDENDYPPTIRVIQRELAISSTSVVDYNLKDLEGSDLSETIELSSDLIPDQGRQMFALRVKGHSMVDALINDGDIVVLRQQETCENGETVAVWLRDQKETTLKRFYLEGERVRLQPANVTMDPIFTAAENVEIQGKLVSVVRSMS